MKIMTDLRNEFHPMPKPNTKPKALPKRINPIGKKTQASLEANKQMKAMFAKLNIKSCELRSKGCWGTNALTFAHPKKRRFLNKADLTQGALLCQPCHMSIEYLPHAEMEKIIMDIIKNRKL